MRFAPRLRGAKRKLRGNAMMNDDKSRKGGTDFQDQLLLNLPVNDKGRTSTSELFRLPESMDVLLRRMAQQREYNRMLEELERWGAN
jgi:hypothetical protein